ncbi:PH domain-containing protein [Shewanella sp. A32]|uniref:PH domain-containing protein n=1 Tax=Shewanella sp. A32 TaxID=3031327 RepID=UPI0023BA3B4D|nr:PH domain-containing protein [Shewanella sp. A32]MDF0535568.1 PH domain-containing protein [Shewanella sp. A32]
MESQWFILAPLGKTAHVSFMLLLLVLLALLMFLLFKPMPATAKAASAGLLLATIGFFTWIYWQTNNAGLSLSAKTLDIKVPLYSQSIALSHLQLQQAQTINLADKATPALSWRTNGVGLPGYSLGWFRLDSGSKAFAAVTDSHNVIMVPTDLGYTLLLSTVDPSSLLRALKAASTP